MHFCVWLEFVAFPKWSKQFWSEQWPNAMDFLRWETRVGYFYDFVFIFSQSFCSIVHIDRSKLMYLNRLFFIQIIADGMWRGNDHHIFSLLFTTKICFALKCFWIGGKNYFCTKWNQSLTANNENHHFGSSTNCSVLAYCETWALSILFWFPKSFSLFFLSFLW